MIKMRLGWVFIIVGSVILGYIFAESNPLSLGFLGVAGLGIILLGMGLIGEED